MCVVRCLRCRFLDDVKWIGVVVLFWVAGDIDVDGMSLMELVVDGVMCMCSSVPRYEMLRRGF